MIKFQRTPNQARSIRRAIRAGRGQVGPCPTDEAHRPLPERRPYVSRYAGSPNVATAVTAANFAGGVILSPLLKANAIVDPHVRCVVLADLSSNSRPDCVRRDILSGAPNYEPINCMAMQDSWLYLTAPLHSNPPDLDDQR